VRHITRLQRVDFFVRSGSDHYRFPPTLEAPAPQVFHILPLTSQPAPIWLPNTEYMSCVSLCISGVNRSSGSHSTTTNFLSHKGFQHAGYKSFLVLFKNFPSWALGANLLLDSSQLLRSVVEAFLDGIRFFAHFICFIMCNLGRNGSVASLSFCCCYLLKIVYMDGIVCISNLAPHLHSPTTPITTSISPPRRTRFTHLGSSECDSTDGVNSPTGNTLRNCSKVERFTFPSRPRLHQATASLTISTASMATTYSNGNVRQCD